MKSKRRFINNRLFEKAAALLALGADKGEAAGQCLESEEIAALVDGSCTREERAKFLRHLSSCKNCYDAWLAVHEMLTSQRSGIKGHLYRLASAGRYKHIGSALAVAASVAIFLNIIHQPVLEEPPPADDAVLSSPEPASEMLQFDRKSDKEGDPQELEEAGGRSAPPGVQPASGLGTGVSGSKIMELDAADTLLQRKAAPSSATAKPVARKARKMKNVSAEEIADRSPAAPSDGKQWITRVTRGCLQKGQDATFWSKMADQGRALIRAGDKILPEGELETVARLLAILEKMNGEAVSGQCDQLMKILTENPDTVEDAARKIRK